ncbi:MAG: DUF4276 family protein [Phycisphaerae bacterium]|nr:DUF4276 family protein [Phycisphaerae bacterium]
MHFEILVEDQSGKKALDILVPKIIGCEHTFRVLSYKGIGHIPRNMRDAKEPGTRILLNNLPKLLKGYGRAFSKTQETYPVAVVVVCDLDDRCLKTFREELFGILNACNPKPETRFCIAIEEGEAWLLGDCHAIRKAFPKAKEAALQSYANDSICGTWEKLADAVYQGGSAVLSKRGWHVVGTEKARWAETIAPNMDIRNNRSDSFCYFCRQLTELTKAP